MSRRASLLLAIPPLAFIGLFFVWPLIGVLRLGLAAEEEPLGLIARVWTDAADSDALRANLAALPGFGDMKVKALGAVLAKRFGLEAARDLVPWHPTLGDVDSPQALAEYQAAKRAHKADWSKAQARA